MAVDNESYMQMQDLYQAEKLKVESLTLENERMVRALKSAEKEVRFGLGFAVCDLNPRRVIEAVNKSKDKLIRLIEIALPTPEDSQ